MPFATQPVRRVAAAEGIRASGHWPHTIPAVRHLLTEGLDLDPGVTFLVGENGAGKSTIVEAVAMAFGTSPEGGSTGARPTTRASTTVTILPSPGHRHDPPQTGLGSFTHPDRAVTLPSQG